MLLFPSKSFIHFQIRTCNFIKIQLLTRKFFYFCINTTQCIFLNCKDQRNATVIILRYTMLRHNGLWDVIHIFPFDKMWRNACIWSSKSCQLHVDFIFSYGDYCIFRIRISMLEMKFRQSVAVPSLLPSVKTFRWIQRESRHVSVFSVVTETCLPFSSFEWDWMPTKSLLKNAK